MTDYAGDASIAMSENTSFRLNSICEISVLYDFRLFELLYKF